MSSDWYDEIKAAGRGNGGVKAHLALSPQTDPFYTGVNGRRIGAEWVAGVWDALGLAGKPVHTRSVHYQVLSHEIETPYGEVYQNTEQNEKLIYDGVKDARYRNLIDCYDLEDHRAAEPKDHLVEAEAASLEVTEVEQMELCSSIVPGLPRLALSPPVVAQAYHCELWIEKSTMDHILEPIAKRYGLVLQTGVGEMSTTIADNLIKRLRKVKRPLRILYVSDFDPAGQRMPVSMARKIEFRFRDWELAFEHEYDVQLHKICLTREQCEELGLPETPIAAKDGQRDDFEAAYGRAATELDALEALHPGTLRRILVKELERFFDPNLKAMVEAKAAEVREELDAVTREVHAEYKAQALAIEREYAKAVAEFNEKTRALRVLHEVACESAGAKLKGRFAERGEIEWPEPREGKEWDNPLYHSERSYEEQLAAYKAFQVPKLVEEMDLDEVLEAAGIKAPPPKFTNGRRM